MANPNLVRKIADNPVGTTGEVSYSDVTEAFANSKNYIMNSNFNFFQRFGTIATWATNAYYVDRWFNGHTGSNEISRRPVTNLPGSNTCLRITYAGGTSNINDFYYLEDFDVAPLKGKTVTWSMYVRRTGSLNNGFRLRVGKNATANTRTGGAWVEILSTLFTDTEIDGSGGWSLISVTFDVPNDGTANGLRLNMVNSVNVTVNGTQFEVTQMMLNIGTTRAPYQPYGGSYSADLLACQRYYEKTYDLDTAPGALTFAGAHRFNHPGGVGVEGNYYFRVTKRITPTITFWNPQSGGSGTWRDTTNAANRVTSTLADIGTGNFSFSTAGVPGGSPDVSGHITADAEFT